MLDVFNSDQYNYTSVTKLKIILSEITTLCHWYRSPHFLKMACRNMPLSELMQLICVLDIGE